MKAAKKMMVLAALVALAAIPAAAQTCGTPQAVNLIAGQSNVAGSVTVSNTSGKLVVTYSTSSGWTMSKTQLAVAASLSGIPTNASGNPIPGHFAYKSEDSPAVTSVTHEIDLDAEGFVLGQTIYIAAQADVQNGSGSEGAWAQGTRFKETRGNWAMYFTYRIQACAWTIQPGDFRTQTQGGWGTACRGQNPGCYRDAHFAQTFPLGLEIGGPSRWVKFTGAAAVKDFLPQGGTAGALSVSDHEAENPTSTAAGVLAGQVVALTLNLGFDSYYADFGASPLWLGALKVKPAANFQAGEQGAACAGMVVADVLAQANSVLSGGGWASASQINECVSRINENFVDGTTVGNYLVLPY
jgi:hypothetical protein